jgi:hypothetical protein
MNTTAKRALVRDFITSKFGRADGHISVWLKRANATKALPVSALEDASAYIERASKSDDAYVAISTQTEQPKGRKRGGAESVRSLTGLFADIDFADAKGAQSGYPESEREALEILSSFSIRPTSIVHSGNGLQAHFDFNTPWRLKTPADRTAAADLSAGFQQMLLAHFRAHDRKIDSVGDIVRNFRPPGTLNHKSNPPKAVRLLEHDPCRRYSVEQIRELLGARTVAPRGNQNPAAPSADHSKILAECAWYRTVIVEGAATCSEPDWFAGASIAALCTGGESAFLAYSSRHPDFRQQEAQDKFRRAIKSDAPRTCASIADDLGHRALCDNCPHMGRITSPIQLGRVGYDPGKAGPLPLGYTSEGGYVFLDKGRQILIVVSSAQLLSLQYLVGLAPLRFWAERFPPRKEGASASPWDAGQVLMEECRRMRPFDPRKVRGRSVWLESDRVIVNFGSPVPSGVRNFYLCFEPLPLKSVEVFDTLRLQNMFQRFIWRNPQDVMLLLGWLAVAPVCGVLSWRPHSFIYGPPNCGKSTIHATASNLLRPLGLSADGQSSEAGIRQMIKADSRPVIIDEFESDQGRSHIGGVIRLARSASSAESPVLRGTPEGKAMQFALRTTFFFAAVNPSGMSPADATRILLFEMLAHNNDPDEAARITDDEAFFSDKGPDWCGYMAGLAHVIPPAIAVFMKALPGIDSRHRKNIATLLAGAFVALECRGPTDAEALAMAGAYKGSIELHAEAFERDDSAECLQHLFAHPVEKQTLGFWLSVALAGEEDLLPEDRTFKDGARRIPRNFEIVVRAGDESGFFIRNGSPAVEAVFRDTKWVRGGWERALRKIGGYFAPKNPIHFAATKNKSRAIGLPIDLLPELDLEELGRDYDSDFAGGVRY